MHNPGCRELMINLLVLRILAMVLWFLRDNIDIGISMSDSDFVV